MLSMLHILNGDSTYHSFKYQSIPGETLVWREVLCEGETLYDLGSPAFWESRKRFFQSFFEVSPQEYQNKVIAEFEKLRSDLSWFTEIVLWFEYDLFCQINMMAILAWLSRHKRRNTKVSLICIGRLECYDKLVALGEINPDRYNDLFDNRDHLTDHELFYARAFWKTYCSKEHNDLVSIAEAAPQIFSYLEEAMIAHTRRFPSTKNGLNEIQQFILTSLSQEKKAIKPLLKMLLQRQNVYGFGDTQYEKYIKDLYPLISGEEELEINALGKKVLFEGEHYTLHAPVIYKFGGTDSAKFRWSPKTDELLAIESL